MMQALYFSPVNELKLIVNLNELKTELQIPKHMTANVTHNNKYKNLHKYALSLVLQRWERVTLENSWELAASSSNSECLYFVKLFVFLWDVCVCDEHSLMFKIETSREKSGSRRD